MYSLFRKVRKVGFAIFGIVALFFIFNLPNPTEAALDGTGSNMIGWWKLDEGSVASSTDSTGNNRTGTVTGSPTYTTGQLNGAISFDGLDDKVAINDFAGPDGTTTITVSAWIQPSIAASTTGYAIVSKTRSLTGFSGWVLYRSSAEKYEFYVRDASVGVAASSDTTFADTSMHHVVGVYNGTDVRIYVDGVSADATPAALTGTIPDGTQKVCIGQSNGGGGVCDGSASTYFPGIIDDVRIYNRALSAGEISQLYNNGLAGIDTVTSPSVTTVAASSLNSTTATINGTTTSNGGDTVTTRGFNWGLTSSYTATTTENGSFGIGAFNTGLSGLTCNTTYHYRAYATNAAGTAYGTDLSFTTTSCAATAPTITTSAASSITSTSTTFNGSITDSGNASSTVRGFIYGLTTSYGATTTENGSFGTGSFSSNVTGLSCNTAYHFKVYATNSGGTGYGSDLTATTSTCSPTITSFTIPTSAASTTVSISSFTATDNIAVTGYLLTETSTTPSAGDASWSGSAPTSFVFRTSGHKTLYAWAKDGSNNISAYATDTINIILSEYTPPIGIPDPSDSFGAFGEINKQTPGWPANWLATTTSAVTDYYFIDNSNGSCTDSSNTYGHPQLPRCSAPEGSLSAGSYVYFNGGTYTPSTSAGDRYDWAGSGTANNPIWITGNPDNQPIFTEKVHLGYVANTSYMIFENITMQGASAGISVSPLTDGNTVDHVIVRNITRTATASDGDQGGILIGISQSNDTIPNSLVSYVVVYDVNISNIGYIGPLGVGGDETGVYMGYHTDHVWVLDSIIHHVGADSVAGSHYSNDTDRLAENYFIGRNLLYQNGENAIDLKVIHNTVISQNIMYGPFQDEGGVAVVLHYGANSLPTTNAWVLFNKIYNVGGGIASTYGDGLHFIGNELNGVHSTSSDPITGACFGFRSSTGVFNVINNTCNDYDEGVAIPSGTLSSGDDVNIFGNIFSNHASSTRYDINIAGGSENQYVDMNYNQFYTSGTPASFRWGGANRNLAYMQGTASECVNCIEADPLFVNAVGGNFALQSGSPARDANFEHAAYDAFTGVYSLNIEKDILGIARPQGGAWDIGAYEFVTSAPDTTPPTVSLTAPSNGVTVSGSSVVISANASDGVGVAGVQFKLDTNTNIGAEDTASAYSVVWDTTAVSNGSYTLIAVARDAAGNYATSSVITVTVDNTSVAPAVLTPPTVVGPTAISGNTQVPWQLQPQVPQPQTPQGGVIGSGLVIKNITSQGRTSAEIRIIQRLLNSDPATMVAKTRVGSPGKETNYFGPATRIAVQKFQLKYGIVKSPRDQGYGVVGPKTKAKMNELLKKK